MKYTIISAYSGKEISFKSILDLLEYERVFKITPEDDGTFTVMERCDDYYDQNLTKEQLLALADEIKALAEGK